MGKVVFASVLVGLVVLIVGRFEVWHHDFDANELGRAHQRLEGLSSLGESDISVWFGNSRLRSALDQSAVDSVMRGEHVFVTMGGAAWAWLRPAFDAALSTPGVQEVIIETHLFYATELIKPEEGHAGIQFRRLAVLLGARWPAPVEVAWKEKWGTGHGLAFWLGQTFARPAVSNHILERHWRAVVHGLVSTRRSTPTLDLAVLQCAQPQSPNHLQAMRPSLHDVVAELDDEDVRAHQQVMSPALRAEIARLVAAARAEGVRVTFVTVPESALVAAMHINFNEAFAALAQELNVLHVDGNSASSLVHQAALFEDRWDNQHMTAAGQEAFTAWYLKQRLTAASFADESANPFRICPGDEE
jgi:hypothetical protein